MREQATNDIEAIFTLQMEAKIEKTHREGRHNRRGQDLRGADGRI
jgi:hypothetical protein